MSCINVIHVHAMTCMHIMSIAVHCTLCKCEDVKNEGKAFWQPLKQCACVQPLTRKNPISEAAAMSSFVISGLRAAKSDRSIVATGSHCTIVARPGSKATTGICNEFQTEFCIQALVSCPALTHSTSNCHRRLDVMWSAQRLRAGL